MTIKNWHVGKLVILWAWSGVLAAVLINVLRVVDNPVVGFILILAIVAAPIALSVLTWRWLSGKER